MPVSPTNRVLAFKQSGGLCGYCGEELTERNLTIDHKVPRCHGGDHSLENLIACCRWCNTSKGRSHIEDFRLRMAAKHLPVRFNAEQLAFLAEIGVSDQVGFDPNRAFHFEKVGRNESSV
ncbi:HNH endonuclease [Pseudomonas phage AF]|uniref:HNH endonuclease n=1 Tax=Pseudomonas phage AF TaxID=1235689 RepID=UPI0002970E58|nr:HNH endonuclease [Pseudomonas phage AF]AFV50663.1 putative HNH endonuclease [Pseudomonas phage AF]